MKAKSLKKAFICSVMSLVMCFSMLVGTTFAWFTDSVTNNVNQIVSGNLDVELHHTKNYNDDASVYEVVASDTALFDELVWMHGADTYGVTMWQPGVESTEGFKIENKGTLPLKYKFSINFANATATPAGKTLADVLVIAVTDANGEVDSFEGTSVLKNFVYEGTLEAGDTYEFTTNISWTQSANDNDYNVAGGLKIDLGVKLLATQKNDAAEYVGDEYEGLVDLVSTPEEFATAMENNGTIVLTDNVALPDDFETMYDATRDGTSYIGEGFTGVLDGNGYTLSNAPSTLVGCLDGGTIKNLTIVASAGSTISNYASESSDSIGAVANLMYGGVIENVTVSGTVTGPKAVGGIVGRIIGEGTIKNCVNNAAVTSTGSSDAAGGIVGKAYYTFEGKEINIIGCVNNGLITGGYAAGGIAGFSAANISNCSNTAEVVSYGMTAGGIVGEQTNYGAITNNTNTANISANYSNGNAGGIIGWIRYQNNPAAYQVSEIVEVSGNYSTANSITARYTAGGIVGLAYNQVNATNNYTKVETISAEVFAAGVIGGLQVDNNNLTIEADVRFVVTNNSSYSSTIEANCTNEFAYNNDPSNEAFAKVEDNMGITTISSAEELTDAFASETPATVNLTEGTYTLPSSSLSEGDVIVCDEGVVFESAKLNINGATVIGATFDSVPQSNTVNGTYKNCTFTGKNGLRYGYAGETVVFENCVFDGKSYGVHFDGGANEVIFRNCTFSGFNALGGAITKLTMEGCTFKALGNSGYNGINLWGDTDMINCTFVFDGSAQTEWVDLCNSNKTVTFTGCVVTDGTAETALKDVVHNFGDGNTIIIDGVTVDIPNMS